MVYSLALSPTSKPLRLTVLGVLSNEEMSRIVPSLSLCDSELRFHPDAPSTCVALTWRGASHVAGRRAHPQWPHLHAHGQVKMQKGERQMAKRFLEERKEELEEVAHELAETEHENTVLRHNIERIKEEKDFTM